MKKGWILAISACLMLTVSAAMAEAEIKVGVVDLQKAMELSEEGIKAKAVFQKKVEKIQWELKTKQDELNMLKEELERKSSMLSEEARFEKEKTYQNRLREFKRVYEDYQEDMRREDAELSEKILRRLIEIIEGYGAEKGYDLILEKTQSGVLYKSKTLEVTEDIIKLFDGASKTP